MCGIVGVVATDGSDVGPLLRPMLESLHHRGPDGAGYVVGSRVCRSGEVEGLDWENAHGPIAIGHTRLAIVGGMVGVQPFLGGNGDITLLHNGEIYNYQDLKPELESTYTFTSRTDSEVLAHLIGSLYSGDLMKAVESALDRCNGVYAVAVTDGRNVVIGRDLVGVRQLYVGWKGPLFAFSSEKKALWSIGVDEGIERLLPGQLISISPSGLSAKRREPSSLMPPEYVVADPGEAKIMYRKALEKAVLRRIQGQERVGIIYSGGIDSVLVAQMARHLGARITCYSAGYSGSSDLYYAHMTAGSLGLSLRSVGLTIDEVETLIPSIIRVIEDRSLGQVEVAVPIFAAVQAAQREGQRVLLTGQAADELFGGYPWYRAIVEQEGYDEFSRRTKDDLLQLYKETLEREDKITMSHSIELRVPYLDPDVIYTAMSIVPQLKITGKGDMLGKHVHRELALEMGVPEEIAMRTKEAAQHGAGVHDVFGTIARQNGFSPKLAEEIGYSARDTVEERLGSSARYGYRYGNVDMWGDQNYVQLYLDTIAYKYGLQNSTTFNRSLDFIEAASRLGVGVK